MSLLDPIISWFNRTFPDPASRPPRPGSLPPLHSFPPLPELVPSDLASLAPINIVLTHLTKQCGVVSGIIDGAATEYHAVVLHCQGRMPGTDDEMTVVVSIPSQCIGIVCRELTVAQMHYLMKHRQDEMNGTLRGCEL